MTRITVEDGVGYVVHEHGEGPPLLMLHGFTGSAATWAEWQPGLGHGQRVIAVDLLGHGGSDSPPAPRQAVANQARDLMTILRRLDAGPADLLGYSFGARIALHLAIDWPGSSRHLVLESPSAGIADSDARAARRTADRRWVEQLQRDDLVGFMRDWAAQPIFASQANLPLAVQQRLAMQRRANRAAGLAASLLGAGQGEMTPLHERLHEVTAATLVVSGELDAPGSERAREVAQGIPNARHVPVAGAGHTPHLEAPDTFRALVTDFLATPTVSPIPAAAR